MRTTEQHTSIGTGGVKFRGLYLVLRTQREEEAAEDTEIMGS
jgi:hypothetical protein